MAKAGNNGDEFRKSCSNLKKNCPIPCEYVNFSDLYKLTYTIFSNK